MSFIIILLFLIIFFFFILFLFLNSRKLNKSIDILLEKGKIKDLRDVLFSHIENTKEVDLELKKVIDRIKSLEEIARIAFQKIGVVRFNPFTDSGPNQSFVIALLDNQNSGFVISSIFMKDSSRIYAKQIINSKSEYTLSKEEKEAIERAMKK